MIGDNARCTSSSVSSAASTSPPSLRMDSSSSSCSLSSKDFEGEQLACEQVPLTLERVLRRFLCVRQLQWLRTSRFSRVMLSLKAEKSLTTF